MPPCLGCHPLNEQALPLLVNKPVISRLSSIALAVRIDIDAPAARKTPKDAQALRASALHDIDINLLDAIFRKSNVIGIRDEIFKHARSFYSGTSVLNENGSPIGLAGAKAVRLEKMSAKAFLHERISAQL